MQAGIIGYPLGHSISPVFQQAAFNSLGIAATYERWPTPPDEMERRVQKLRQPNILGANVTVPHKERVIALLDEIDPIARRIGAVNTIVNRNGRLTGHNTDAPGFLRSLTNDAGFSPQGKAVVVLGAGGAARAVMFALAQAGAKSIALCNRTESRAEALATAVRSQADAAITVLPWGAALPRVDLIVHTTTMGMRGGNDEQVSPLGVHQIPKAALVCDLVYNPAETPLIAAAKTAGAQTLGGLPMLVYQGAIAFELWTGREAPADVMLAAARKAL